MATRPVTSRIKAPSPIVQAAIVLAAAGVFTSWQFTHRAVPLAPQTIAKTVVRTVVQKATGAIVLDRSTALAVLSKNPSALAARARPAMFISGGPATGAIGSFLVARGYAACVVRYRCALTAKGREQRWPTEKTLFSDIVSVPLYTVRVDRITGISGGIVGFALGSEVADFDATEIPNDVGRALGLHDRIAHGQATFSKYDDGFRLADVGFTT